MRALCVPQQWKTTAINMFLFIAFLWMEIEGCQLLLANCCPRSYVCPHCTVTVSKLTHSLQTLPVRLSPFTFHHADGFDSDLRESRNHQTSYENDFPISIDRSPPYTLIFCGFSYPWSIVVWKYYTENSRINNSQALSCMPFGVAWCNLVPPCSVHLRLESSCRPAYPHCLRSLQVSGWLLKSHSVGFPVTLVLLNNGPKAPE